MFECETDKLFKEEHPLRSAEITLRLMKSSFREEHPLRLREVKISLSARRSPNRLVKLLRLREVKVVPSQSRLSYKVRLPREVLDLKSRTSSFESSNISVVRAVLSLKSRENVFNLEISKSVSAVQLRRLMERRYISEE